MADFVDDNLALLPTKVDAKPLAVGANPALYTLASDTNSLSDWAGSLRTAIKTAKYGLVPTAALASAGALTPSISGDTFLELTLDAAGTLNVPVALGRAATVGGVKLSVKVVQDGTGYRSLSLHSSIVGGSRFMPRQGPGQVSTFELRRSAAGTWYLHSFDGIDKQRDLWWEDFGADPTGAADSWKAIQWAIDTSIYSLGSVYHPDVRGGPGNFKTSDTVHVGYGETLHNVRLRGSGMGSRGDSYYGGTSIRPTFSDRPCINVAGGRNSLVSDMALWGKLSTWIETNHLCESADLTGSDPVIDDKVAANWVDPSLASTQDGRYTPYCGLSTDAYQGTAPVGAGNQYPNVTFTSISGVSGQYNKAPSSNTTFRNVSVRGFNTGFVATPSGSDGNGDFPKFENCIIEQCKWGMSISHTQCRNVDLLSVSFATLYCAFTNRTHGLKSGKFGGTWTDVSVGGAIKLFDFGSLTIGGPIVATTFYAEALYRLGDYNEAASNALALKFIGGQFSFTLQNNRRGIPADVVGPLNQVTSVAFDRCLFDSFPSVMLVQLSGTSFDDCTFHCSDRDAGTDQPYKALAHNALVGGLVLGYGASTNVRNSHFTQFNIDTVTAGAGSPVSASGIAVTHPDFQSTNRLNCTPFYCREVRTNGDQFRNQLFTPQVAPYAWNIPSFSSVSVSGRDVTIVHASLADDAADLYGMMPGDVLLDALHGTVFFIRSRTTTTVIARAQNNYKLVGGVETVNDTPSTGYLYAINSRFYTPSYAIKGTVTSGSATISAVQRGDGYAGFLATEVKVGDSYFIDEFTDLPFYRASSKVTAVTNGSPGSMALNGNANVNQTGRRLAWFIRAAPANV